MSNYHKILSLFYHALTFNQDISQWNVANVKNMDCMFADNCALLELLQKCGVETPFNLPNTHKYHNWTRKKIYIKFSHDVYNFNNISGPFGIFEMIHEIGNYL